MFSVERGVSRSFAFVPSQDFAIVAVALQAREEAGWVGVGVVEREACVRWGSAGVVGKSSG